MKEFSQLLLDTANGRVANYSTEDANAAIRNHFAEVIGADGSDRKALRKAIRRHKVDIYELIEEVVESKLQSGWGENPFFREYVEQRNLALGDKNDFYVPDASLLTVSKFSGNHHDLLRQKLGAGTSLQVSTYWYGIKIYDEFERMMTGQIDWAAFVEKIYAAFDKKLNDMIYTSFMSADSKLPTDLVITGSLTKAAIVDLVEELEVATGCSIDIVGTRAALNKVTDLLDGNWISEDMKKERATTGSIGEFEGIRLVRLPQVFETNTRTKLIDNNKLLFVPNSPDFKPIKLVNEGESMFNEVTDSVTNMDMTIEAEYMQKLGIAVVINMLYGVYNIA